LAPAQRRHGPAAADTRAGLRTSVVALHTWVAAFPYGWRRAALCRAARSHPHRQLGPALVDFYNARSDEQKARFKTVGRQLFAEK